MPKVPRQRGHHLRRAGTGLLALLALGAVVQSWSYFSAEAVPRSNMARRVSTLADIDDAASGTTLALAAADPASIELTDVRVAEADAVPESRPSPPDEETSTEEASVDVEPAPELSMTRAEPEMAVSPVDPGEDDIGSAVENPRPEGEGLPGVLVGTGEDSQGPLSGIGGGLGPLIGVIGGIVLGGGSGPSPFTGPGPFIVGGGGSGCEGPGVQFPGPIAAGPQSGESEGPGPLGGNPTSGSPTIRIPTTVPADPSGIIGSGGRGFLPEAPDLGRTNDSDFGRGGTSPVAGRSAGNVPVTGAAVVRLVDEASRSFGTRRSRSSFSRPATRQLQGSSANAASPTPATMRERVQRALASPTQSQATQSSSARRMQPATTTPTRSAPRATQARVTQTRAAQVRAAQVRPTTPNRAARAARPAATQARSRVSGSSAAVRRATPTRAAAARPTRALPTRRSQQQ